MFEQSQSLQQTAFSLRADQVGQAQPHDFAILRMALAELIHCPEVPINVIINEAIEIAHRFSSGKAGKFVNGILDKLAREIRDDGST